MRWRITAAFVLFIIIAVSTSIYGGFIIYRNNQLDTNDGSTEIMGIVVSSSSDPIQGAIVQLKESEIITGSDGRFHFRNVSVGMIDLEVYKEGFIPLEIRWLAYPMDELDGDLERSPNNISTERTIELLREREQIKISETVTNGTFDLIVIGDIYPVMTGRTFEYGPEEDHLKEETIGNETKVLTLDGNGTFIIKVGNDSIKWKNLPGSETDITNILRFLYGLIDEPGIAKINFTIDLSEPLLGGSFEIELIDPLDGPIRIYTGTENEMVKNINVSVHPGICSILLSGREIRDREYQEIIINEKSDGSITLDIVEAQPDTMLKDLDLSWNYMIGGVYICLSIIFLTGAFLTLKGYKWTYIIVIALLGFLVRGFYLGSFPLNLIISIVLVLLLLFSREDFEMRRKDLGK